MKRFRITSLHTALIVRFVAAAILPLLVFGWYGYRHQLEQKTTDIALDLQGHALTISAEIEGFVEELQYELKIARATRTTDKWFILDAAAVNVLDSTGVATLADVREELAEWGVAFGIADLNTRSRRLVARRTNEAIRRCDPRSCRYS